jgi:hypothetical protein
MKSKKVTLSQKSYDHILDAWSKMNCFCAYLKNPEVFTEKFNAQDYAKEIFKHLDAVVAKLPDRE